MRIGLIVAVGASALFLAGCGTEPTPGPAFEDCSARIRYAGEVYGPNSDLKESAPPGEPLGYGTEVDCDGSALDRRVRVHALRGIAPANAIIVTGLGAWRGIYISEHLRRSEWPTALRRR